MELSVWIMLFVVGYAGLSATVERILFHLSRRLADERSLRELLQHWRTENRLQIANTDRLGWLRQCLNRAQADGSSLLDLCLRERLQMIRFTNLLPMVADVATAAGLLAAVISLYQTANAAEHGAVMALGMRATIAGLMIAIPIKIFLGLSADRTDRLLTQADLVIDSLEEMLFQPSAMSACVDVASSDVSDQPGRR